MQRVFILGLQRFANVVAVLAGGDLLVILDDGRQSVVAHGAVREVSAR